MTSLCAGFSGIVQVEEAVYFGFPRDFQGGRLGHILLGDAVVLERRRKLLEGNARIGHHGNRCNFVSVKLRVLMLTNFTCEFWKAVIEAEVKSE